MFNVLRLSRICEIYLIQPKTFLAHLKKIFKKNPKKNKEKKKVRPGVAVFANVTRP